MALTETEIALIRDSFARLAENGDAAGEAFYLALFEIAPEFAPMFSESPAIHGRRLVGMLGTVVRDLSRLEALMPAVEALGRRHAQLGVQPEHYRPVALALDRMLMQRLGREATGEVRGAWMAAFALLSSAMIMAADAPLEEV